MGTAPATEKRPAYAQVILALTSQKNGTKLTIPEVHKLCPGVKVGTVGSTLSRLVQAGLLDAAAGQRPVRYAVQFGSLNADNLIDRYRASVAEYDRNHPRTNRGKSKDENEAPDTLGESGMLMLIPIGENETAQVTLPQARAIYRDLHLLFGGAA